MSQFARGDLAKIRPCQALLDQRHLTAQQTEREVFALKHDSGERPSQGEGAGNPESALPPSHRSLGGRGTDADWVEAQLSRIDLLLEQLAEPGALAQLLLDELA